jgi:transaldolase
MDKLKIYLDTADLKVVKKFSKNSKITGFTSNPTIIKKQKVKNYKSFAKKFASFTNKPISLEVFADDFTLMEKEAIILNSYGKNIYIKIPIINSKGKSSIPLIKKLLLKKIKINITAVFTVKQIKLILEILKKNYDVIISIFCGRIMDSGIYPDKISSYTKKRLKKFPNVKILWASTREVFNIIQAKQLNFDIITITPEIFSKMKFIGYNQSKFSKDTVAMFIKDAKQSRLKII